MNQNDRQRDIRNPLRPLGRRVPYQEFQHSTDNQFYGQYITGRLQLDFRVSPLPMHADGFERHA